MDFTDEELLHAFYAGNIAVLTQLAERLAPILARIAWQTILHRTGRSADGEWDIDERLQAVWVYVLRTRQSGIGRWPHERLSAFTWIVHLLGLEMDRHLGFRPPF